MPTSWRSCTRNMTVRSTNKHKHTRDMHACIASVFYPTWFHIPFHTSARSCQNLVYLAPPPSFTLLLSVQAFNRVLTRDLSFFWFHFPTFQPPQKTGRFQPPHVHPWFRWIYCSARIGRRNCYQQQELSSEGNLVYWGTWLSVTKQGNRERLALSRAMA